VSRAAVRDRSSGDDAPGQPGSGGSTAEVTPGPNGDTRQRIIDAAARLFASQGYDRTPVTAIEEASGLSPGAGGLYRHFASKRDILEAVVESAIAGSLAATTPAGPPPDDLAAAAEALAQGATDRLTEEMPLLGIILRDLPQFPDLMARAEAEWFRLGQQAASAWVEHYRDTGHIDADVDVEATALAIMGMVLYHPMIHWVTGVEPLGVSRERVVAAVTRLLTGLAPR